jgi:hypothetical protein
LVEPLGQRPPPPGVDAAAQPAEQVDDLPAGQARPQRQVARHVRQPPVQLDRVAPRIAAEQRHLARVGLQQPQQDTDRGGLARAVRPQEGMHLTGTHLKIQPVERDHTAKPLGQPHRTQHHVPAGHPGGRRPARAYPISHDPTPRKRPGVATLPLGGLVPACRPGVALHSLLR